MLLGARDSHLAFRETTVRTDGVRWVAVHTRVRCDINTFLAPVQNDASLTATCSDRETIVHRHDRQHGSCDRRSRRTSLSLESSDHPLTGSRGAGAGCE